MSDTNQITLICKLPVEPETLTALDRMAANAGKSRDALLADFAHWLVSAEEPPTRRRA